jgi:hypothetical protein
VISEANQAIKNLNKYRDDENQTRIYFMAYELLTQDSNKVGLLYENPKFWKFRPVVTFDLMAIELGKESKESDFKLLKRFTDLLYQLQFLPKLAEIVGLIKLLTSALDKAIFKSEAKKESINSVVNSMELPKGLLIN